jgi:hypothetical protein
MIAILTRVRWNPETLKLLQEIIEKTLEDISLVNYFLNIIPITQDTRVRIDKWNCINLKSFCISREKITIIKGQPKEWEMNLCQLFNE